MKKYVVVILLLTTGWLIARGNTSPKSENPQVAQSDLQEILPFAEMTIPYLRDRAYVSKLKELTQYQEKNNYTSYLTSYDSDGLNINGLLTIPKGDMPNGGWPAVVFVHGYIAPSTYKTTEKYGDYVDYLARNKLVVFKIDLRGHGTSEGEPGGAYYSSDYVIDTLNGRAALSSAEFVNPDQIGLWGHSMAGNVTLRALASVPTIPALVIWAGAGYSYEDLVKYGLNDNSYRSPATSSNRQRRRSELREKYGDFSPTHEFWKQVAPTNYLAEVKGAVQVHHAVDDTVVNIGYSRDLVKKLEENSVRHELYEYPGGGHNISGNSFNLAMQRTVDFFRKELAN